MSAFYDLASLVVVPSGYKSGKIYAQKPLTTDGQLAFTRTGDTASRIAPNGLIEKVRTNRYIYSNDFTNAAWSKVGGVTVTGGQADPDGGTNAFLYERTVAFDYLAQFTTNGVYTVSITAKANASNFLRIGGFSGGDVLFNLATGVIVSQSSATGVIQSLGNGWYRCSAYIPTAATTHFIQNFPVANGTSGAGSVYIYKAQLETGDIATEPILTTTAAVSVGPVANVPRLDYLGSSCPRLLLEPQRQNLALFSESFDNAAWINTNVTITANTAISPDGYQNADTISVGVDASPVRHRILQSNTLTVGTTYTGTYYFKAINQQWIQMVGVSGFSTGVWANFDLVNGTIGNTGGVDTNASIEDVGNGWFRCRVSGVATGTSSTGFEILTINNTDSGRYPNVQSLVAEDVCYVWGAQLEAGSYVSSYIPSLGAAVTRGADIIPNQTTTIAQAFSDDSQGTILFDISNIDSNATGSEARWRFGSSATPLQIALILESNGLRVYSYNGNFTLTPSNKLDRRIAIRFNGTEIVAFVNGVKQTTFNAATAFDIEQLTEIQTSPGTFGLNQFILFPTALSDADAIALTA